MMEAQKRLEDTALAQTQRGGALDKQAKELVQKEQAAVERAAQLGKQEGKMKKEREAMLKKLLAEKTQLAQKTEQLTQDKTGVQAGIDARRTNQLVDDYQKQLHSVHRKLHGERTQVQAAHQQQMQAVTRETWQKSSRALHRNKHRCLRIKRV